MRAAPASLFLRLDHFFLKATLPNSLNEPLRIFVVQQQILMEIYVYVNFVTRVAILLCVTSMHPNSF
jgi:hypothetical protein